MANDGTLPGDSVSEIFDPSAWTVVDGFDFTDITYHRSSDVGAVRIAFDRPEVRNAFRPHTVDELYTALERNTIDALEWVGPGLDFRMGFHKIAPYYYTGWHEPASELQFLINRRSWDQLPSDLQEILRIAMRAAAYDMYARSYHESAVNWASIE